MSFTDTGFVVRLLSEKDQSNYTIRVLELQNTKVSMRGNILNINLPVNQNSFSGQQCSEINSPSCFA